MQYGAGIGTVRLGKVVGGMVVNSKYSGMGWDLYSRLDVTTGSGCDMAATKVLAGATGNEEWHTCILDRGIIYPFWNVTTLAK